MPPSVLVPCSVRVEMPPDAGHAISDIPFFPAMPEPLTASFVMTISGFVTLPSRDKVDAYSVDPTVERTAYCDPSHVTLRSTTSPSPGPADVLVSP